MASVRRAGGRAAARRPSRRPLPRAGSRRGRPSGGLDFLGEPLALGELGVDAALREQLVVRPRLGDPAVLEDDDEVGVLERREAVRDEEDGPARPRRPSGPERIRASVSVSTEENASSRIRMGASVRRARASAGALLLPSGEGDAPLADDRVEPLRERRDVGPEARRFTTRSISARVASGRPNRDVAGEGVREEERLLRDDDERSGEGRGGERPCTSRPPIRRSSPAAARRAGGGGREASTFRRRSARRGRPSVPAATGTRRPERIGRPPS